MRAAGHRRIRVALREPGHRDDDRTQIGLEQVERSANLQDAPRVHDVLRRRAVMDVAPCISGGTRHRVHERNERMLRRSDLGSQLLEVVELRASGSSDRR